MWKDVRFGVRVLARGPVFTCVAVLSLALGIGANTAIFSLMSQVMFRMLPVADPERLVVLHTDGQREGSSSSDSGEAVFSYPMYKDLRDRNQVFSGVIARSSAPVSLSYEGQTERARAELLSGNFFEVLGVSPAIGRLFTPEDDGAPGAHPVVVLGHGYWKRRFGGSAAIVGQKIDLNGHPMVVLGVAPAGFHGVLSGDTPDVMTPIAMKREISPTLDVLDDRLSRWLSIFGRLRHGVSSTQAAAAMRVLYRSISEEELTEVSKPIRGRTREVYLNQALELRPAAQGINALRSDWETPLIALMAMVGLVLLIACANVANLMLGRAAGRQKEIAIRLAMGARRMAIARQLVVESLIVATLGALAALPVSAWTTDALLRFLPEDATGGWLAAGFDFRTLAFTAALAVATGLVFGTAPAIASMRTSVGTALKDQSANATASGGHARLRRVFIVAQVALSLVLLVGAGLFARSLFNLMTEDPGFRAQKLLMFSVDPSLAGYDSTRGWAFYHDLQERLLKIPGVGAVGGASYGPFGHSNSGGNITVEGYQAREDEYVGAQREGVTPEYFHALGIPMVAGREFTDRDNTGAPKAVIVNQSFAKAYGAGGNLLGKHMTFGGGNNIKLDREIVGIVRNSKYGNLRETVKPFVYTPYTQMDRLERMTYFVRTSRNEGDLGPDVRRVVRAMDTNLPVFDMHPMQMRIDDSIYRDRLVATLASAFGLLATLLAAIGLYGVVTFNVTRRTAEMGVRMALGAVPRDVLALVMKEVGVLVACGSAIGLGTALPLARYVESQLFGVRARDPLVFACAVVALAAVAVTAGYIPARRASRIDPIRALRYE